MAAPAVSIPRRFQRYWNATTKRESEPSPVGPTALVDKPPAEQSAEQSAAQAPALPATLIEYCRVTTPAWNWDWPHLQYVAGYLDQLSARTITRLEINLPTRIGKTELLVRYIAQRFELNPTINVIVGAYNRTFARRLSRKIRKQLTGRIELSREQKSIDHWETAAGGSVIAVGVGVGVAGLPADLIVVDDPIKNREDAYSKKFRDKVDEWYREDLYTRLEPTGQIILNNARRHEDDLSGRIQASEEAGDWIVVRLPALAEANDPLGRKEGAALCPDRFDEAYYAQQRRATGEAAFASMQQQRPAPASGLIFNSEWFRYYTTKDHPIVEDGHAVPFLPDRFDTQLQSWDMSFKDKAKSDFVAGHVWKARGADCYMGTDRVHGRLSFTKTLEAVGDLTKRNTGAQLKLVEDKANGSAVIDTLKSKIQGLVAVEPDGDKVARAYAVTHLWEAGNVWLPHPAIAPWVKAFKLELLQFPLGAHDDDVDAMTQALRRLSRPVKKWGSSKTGLY